MNTKPQNRINTIAILGGSFNPPTVAHAAVLAHATKESGADLGLLVPSSDLYVQRKTERHKDNPLGAPGVIPFSQRMNMCRIYTRMFNDPDKNPFLSVSNAEIDGNAWGNTCVMLDKLAIMYPGARLLFIIGDDKLRILHKWGNIETLLSRYEMLVLPRKTGTKGEIMKALKAFPETADHLDRFTILPPLDNSYMRNISSSAFWKSFLSKNPEESALRHVDHDIADMVAIWHTKGKCRTFEEYRTKLEAGQEAPYGTT